MLLSLLLRLLGGLFGGLLGRLGRQLVLALTGQRHADVLQPRELADQPVALAGVRIGLGGCGGLRSLCLVPAG
ncbi:MAG TPA: hypothetical protein DEQ43_08860, partial [Nocardioides bacterium]|nr:hypothetical protein [Nocardioides sp.]